MKLFSVCGTCLDEHGAAGLAAAALTVCCYSEVVRLSTVQPWKLTGGAGRVAALHLPS